MQDIPTWMAPSEPGPQAEERDVDASSRLLARKAEIITAWKERLKRDVPPAKNLPDPMLRDEVPDWIDRLAQTLASADAPFRLRKISIAAAEHGRQRADLDFDLNELLYEYVALRQVLLDVLEQDSPLPGRQRDLILDAIQLSSRAAVLEYTRLHRHRREHRLIAVGSRSHFSRALVSIGMVAAATLLQWLAWPWLAPFAYILYYPATALASLYGSPVLAIVLSVLTAQLLFVDPGGLIASATFPHVARALVFVISMLVIAKVTRDLRTSRKLAEGYLEEREKTLASLDALLASSPFGIAFLDRDLKYLSINEPLARWNGRSVEDHIGRKLRDMVPNFEPTENLFKRVLETGKPVTNLEVEMTVPSDGAKDRRSYLASFYPVRTSQELVGVGGILIDITDQKRTQRELHDRNERLTQERALREQFVSTLSHDLRTPLTAARVFAQIIKKEPGDPARIGAHSLRVVQNIDRADRMIRDLLDSNRVRAGQQLPLEREPAELTALVRGVVEELERVHGERFRLQLESEERGEWDVDGVRRIIENLCSNALKHGSDTGQVTVRVLGRGPEVELCVHNFGDPIASDDRKRLFEHFERSSRSGATRGWGIGLTLVRGMTEAHGGRVSVESDRESGTTFIVTLPRRAGT
jgi:PAS domain S-box-containing protein